MTTSDPLTPPQQSGVDKAIAVTKAFLADFIPGGGTVAELAGQFLRTPYQKRADEWQQAVGEVLHRLATEKNVDLEELQQDDQFVDVVFQATQVALRNSQREKHEALRNAVMNSALPHAPEESEQQMFLQIVDRFTVWHLKLLEFFDNPQEWCRRNNRPTLNNSIGSSVNQALEQSLHELKGKGDFYKQVCSELDAAGLTEVSNNLNVMMSSDGWKASRTTERGRTFLKFISDSPA